ncbi:MAG: hypothetical protein LBI29_01440 [Rickettsiales bacterium]|nr:hypothetical protein [Rickettsiales bacterium]
MSNNRLREIFLFCLVLVSVPRARSEGYQGIASVSRSPNSTSVEFFGGRPSREIVRGQTASFGVRAGRFAGDVWSVFYSSSFSGKLMSKNYNEPGVGDGVFYNDPSTAERIGIAVSVAGIAVAVIGGGAFGLMKFSGFTFAAVTSGALMAVAGLVTSLHKLYTEADWGIDIRPDGVTQFGYFKSRRKGPEGEGTIIWSNGIGYEGAFEDNRIKNNPSGKLILFPEEDKYTVEFSRDKDRKYRFPDVHYFNNVDHSRLSKSIAFTNGDVFRGVIGRNVEGIYIPKNGSPVKSTLRNILLKKMEEEKRGTVGTGTDSRESICEETMGCGD